MTDATGINGREIISALSENPKTSKKVYSMSQRQKPSTSHQTLDIQHSTLDLQSSSTDMTEQLTDVEASYLFFCAYNTKGSEQENVDANVPMLSNLPEVLGKTGAEKRFNRVILTAGLKQLRVQWRRPENLMEGSDPPLRADDRPSNF